MKEFQVNNIIKNMKIVTIIGARPQFIKAAVISRYISTLDNVHEVIVHTGQHFDKNMSDIFFEEMGIPKADYNLNINSLSHGAMTGQMLEKIEQILFQEKPDWVLVYGDTNSTLAGALAAKKNLFKLAHVEAGLRSFNMAMPEEVNRILTDRVSDILFCPTTTAINNLNKEGFSNFKSKILHCGDVMQDAAIYYSKNSKPVDGLSLTDNFVLCTVHRAENTDNIDNLKDIFKSLEDISNENQVVIPIHPRTRKILQNINYDFENSKIKFIDPVGYLEMVWLLEHCKFVMTDSGGLQKEAYFFKKYCITMREETEWVELVENNYNILVGSDYTTILKSIEKIGSMKNSSNNFSEFLYGKGNAGEIIVNELLNFTK